jgi:hypothetical protein
VYVFSRFGRGAGRRLAVGMTLAIALVVNTVGTSIAAGTTGNLSGTVTADKTGLPVQGVVVSVVSPTERSTTKTDAKGFFAFTGLTPDTYTVSFELNGYEAASVTGINIVPDGDARVDQKLSKALTTIGTVTSRSPGGAYQPSQTNDTYTVTSSQIQTIQGKENDTSEVNLLTSLPGASLDSSGYPVLRGGRENEEGYQFEGISIVDSFSNQFQNSLSVNGIQNFQLTPGAGNATNGNAGTGTINYTAKRGTYPAFGSIEADVASFPYTHQLSVEYGFATPDGSLSNYFSFIGQRDGTQFGPVGTRAVDIGAYFLDTDFSTENNFVDNFIYKFGHNKDTELQLLYQNQIDYFSLNYGGGQGLGSAFTDPYASQVGDVVSYPDQLFGSETATGAFTAASLASILQPLPGHPNLAPNGGDYQYQPENVYKVQLSHNFSSSAFLKAYYYGVNAVTQFNFNDPEEAVYEGQGSLKHGVQLDFTDQVNSKNLVQIGGSFAYNRPVFFINSYNDAVEAIGTGLGGLVGIGPGQGFELADFLPASDTYCAAILGALGSPPGTSCGYISSQLPNAKIPYYDRTAQVDRGDYAAYINDQFAASDRLKIEAGLRLDANDTKFPGTVDGETFNIPNAAEHPFIWQPRLAASFELTKNDAIRASYARSTQFPPLGDLARTIDPSSFTQFDSIPSYNVLTGAPASYCGVKQNLPCANYGQQLYSEYQAIAGVPIQPVVPETFTNFDFSYSHQFPSNFAIKVTPFYTRGYDIVDRVANVIAVDPATNRPILGPALATNDGIERTTGVEFLLTREAQYGFSGQLAATYLNKLSNVPPLSADEDFFPTIPTASLALGNLYRVGYLSPFQATLAMQYKSRGGLRINPQITYTRGYPYNNGLYTATYINGVPVNIPLTDVTGPSVGSSPSQFVDPANPGTVFKPNVDATLGTPETRDTGGLLSNARFSTNLTVEFSPPNSRSTFGVQIFNLFNQLYGNPSLNGALQPVANGVLGPQTGKLAGYAYPYTLTSSGAYLAATPYSQYGNLPYVITSGNEPVSLLLYYNVKL